MATPHRPHNRFHARGPRNALAVYDASSHDIVDPAEEDRFWHRYFRSEPYHDSRLTYDDYGPAFRLGIAHRLGSDGQHPWRDCEAELQALWTRHRGRSRLDWEEACAPVRAAWHRVDKALAWR